MWQYLLLTRNLSASNVAIPASVLKLQCQQCGNICFWPEVWMPAMWQYLFLPWTNWVPAVVRISSFDLKFECQHCGNTCFCLELLLERQQLWQYLLLTWSLGARYVAIPASDLKLECQQCGNTCFCLELLLECEELLDGGLHVGLGSLRALQVPHLVPLAETNTMTPTTQVSKWKKSNKKLVLWIRNNLFPEKIEV